MGYSTGGKIGVEDTLKNLRDVRDTLKDLQRQRNIKFKFGLDLSDYERANELLEQFDEKAKNGMNDYYMSASVRKKALKKLEKDYENLRSFEKESQLSGVTDTEQYQRIYDRRANSIVRQANAYMALDGAIKEADKDIFNFAKTQEKILMNKTGGNYQYTVDNFRELFNIMKELNPLLEKNIGLSKNYSPISPMESDFASIEEHAKKADQYLSDMYKKYGTGKLPEGTRNKVEESLGLLGRYYKFREQQFKEEVPRSEAYNNALGMDVRKPKESPYGLKGWDWVKEEYDKIIERLTKEALKKAEIAQEGIINDYEDTMEAISKGFDSARRNIEANKKRIYYDELEQTKKLSDEWTSLEDAKPQFSENGQIGGAYMSKESFNEASQLYDSLFDQIEEGAITSDEAIKAMAKDLFDAVRRGEATPFLTDDVIAYREEIEKLQTEVLNLRDALEQAKDDIRFWRDNGGYGGSGSGYGVGDYDNAYVSNLEDNLKALTDELEYEQKHSYRLELDVRDLENENHQLREELNDNTEAYQDLLYEHTQTAADLDWYKINSEKHTPDREVSSQFDFTRCCETLSDIESIISKINLDSLSGFDAFGSDLTNILTSISESVLALKGMIETGSGKIGIAGESNIQINQGTQIHLGGEEDPVLRARFEELNDALESMQETVKVTQVLESQVPKIQNELDELYQKRKATLSVEGADVEIRKREVEAIDADIEATKRRIEIAKKEEAHNKRKITTYATLTRENILDAVYQNVPEATKKSETLLEFQKRYSTETIEKLPLKEGVERLTELLKMIKQLAKKNAIGTELSKVVKKNVRNFPALDVQEERQRLSIEDTIDSMLSTLQHISGQVESILQSLNGEMANDIPNLASQFLSDRGQNLKQLYKSINILSNGTFSKAGSNEENIINFLKQFNAYGKGKWNLDEFARINQISEKNLAILKKYNDELLNQQAIIDGVNVENKVVNIINDSIEDIEKMSVSSKETSELLDKFGASCQATTLTLKRLEESPNWVASYDERNKHYNPIMNADLQTYKNLIRQGEESNEAYMARFFDMYKSYIRVQKSSANKEDKATWIDYNNFITEQKKIAIKEAKAQDKLNKGVNVKNGKIVTDSGTVNAKEIITILQTCADYLANIQQDVGILRQSQGWDLEAIYPRGDMSGDKHYVATPKIIPVKKKALEETNAAIETLEATNTTVEKKVNSEIKEFNNQSNELANAIKGWVEASNMMSKATSRYADEGLDRERVAYGDIRSGKISNAYVVGDEHKISGELNTLVSQTIDKLKYQLDIHSHPADYIAPSGWKGDLSAYGAEGTKQALIVGRKQSLLLNTSMLEESDLYALAMRYDELAAEYVQDEQKRNEILSNFLEKFSSLTKGNKYGDNYKKFVLDELFDYINNVFEMQARFSKKQFSGISKELFNDRLEQTNFDFLVGSQQSAEDAVRKLLESMAEFSNFKIDSAVQSLASNLLDSASRGAHKYKISYKQFSGDAADQRVYQEALKDAFNYLFSEQGLKFGDFAKYLNYENADELTVSAINDFLGIQNTENTYLGDIAQGVREIIGLLHNGVSTPEGQRQHFEGRSAPKKNTQQDLEDEEEALRIDQERVKTYNETYKINKAIERQKEKELNTIQKAIDKQVEEDNKQQQKAFEERQKQEEKASAQRKKQHEETISQIQEELKAEIDAGEKAVQNKTKTDTKDRELLRQALLDKAKKTQSQLNEEKREELDLEKKHNKELEKEQKDLDELSAKYRAILEKKNNEGNQFFTQDYLDSISEALTKLNSGQLSVADGRNLLSGITDPNNIVAAQKTLKNYIIKGQKLIAQNYMPADIRGQMEELVEVMSKVSREGGHSRTEVNKLIGTFQDLEGEAAKAGKSLWGQIGQRLQDMNAKFIATYFSFMDIIRYVRTMISTITELDTALTEMRKVSDESVKSLKEYQRVTFDTASALGTTAIQLQQSTADWLRLGESMEEASKSAVAATTLFNVSEFENVNDATTALVAMSQAYKDLDKTEIIDVMNNIGNNYAIATNELATALQASAASLMTQGNDLYEAAALVTAGNQIIQDADKVGTGIRTISLRIAGVKEGDDDIKAELEELGEEVDDWVVSTQAKKRQVIMDYTRVASNMGQGVDILDSNGNLKDTYTILLEIAKIYKEIQEEDKKYGTNRAKGLVEELAGKNRSNIAASILMNPELLEDVYESAKDSAGSAAEENAKYLDSIVGKTQQFKNELQELEYNLVDAEWLKDIIDFGTTILSIINKIGKGLPIIATGIGSIAAAVKLIPDKTQGFFKYNEANGKGNKSYDLIKGLLGVDETFAGIDFKDEDLKEYFKILGSDAPEKAAERFAKLNSEQQVMAQNLQGKGVNSLKTFTDAEKQTGAAASATATQVGILNTVINTIAIMAIISAVTGLIKLLDKLSHASEEAAEAAYEFTSSLRDTRKELKSQKDYIDDVGEEYEKLSKGVDKFGNNLTLSTEDFARYNEITNELADMFPTLIDGWTESGDAIMYTTNSVRDLTAAYEENRKQALATLVAGEDANSVFKNYNEVQKANIFERIRAAFNGEVLSAGKGMNYKESQKYLEALTNTSYSNYNPSLLPTNLDILRNPNLYRIETALQSLNGKNKFLGIGYRGFKKYSEEEYQAMQIQAEAQIIVNKQQMEEALRPVRELAVSYLEFNPEYDKLSDESKDVARQFVNSLDASVYEEFANNPVDLQVWVNESLKTLKGIDSEAINTLFDFNFDNDDFKEGLKERQEAWKNASKKLDKQIQFAEAKGDEAEVKRLKDLKNRLYEASSLSDMNELDKRFRTQLRDVAGDRNEEQRLKQYTASFTKEQMELWLSVTNGAKDATTAIEQYEEAIKKVYYSKYDNIGALLSQDTEIDNISWGEIRDDLVGLAQAGKLDEQTLRDYKYFNEIIEQLGLSADATDEEISQMIDDINKMAVNNAVDDLSNYRTEMDKLQDAYSKFKNNEFIDANTLSALQDAFGDLDSYQEFEKAVMSGETALQQYFDNIATEYAKQHIILANLNEENKEAVKQNLVLAGITKESADASVEAALKKKKSIESEIRSTLELMNTEVVLNKGRKDLAVSTENLDKLTAEEIVLLMNEANASGEAAQQVALFMLKKELAAGRDLRNPDDLNYLTELIIKCGVAANEIDRLKRLGEMSGTIDDAKAALDAFDARYSKSDLNRNSNLQAERKKLTDRVNAANQAYDKFNTGIDSLEDRIRGEMEKVDYTVDLDFDYSGAVDSASGAGAEAAEDFKSTLDKILAMYDAELDAGVIAFQTYVDKSRAIIEQYYREGKITAQDYYDELASLYEKQVSEYDKVISAVQRYIQKQVDALNKQKESIEESYNSQIEEIQKKIDALQDENDEIDRNIALQKAQ